MPAACVAAPQAQPTRLFLALSASVSLPLCLCISACLSVSVSVSVFVCVSANACLLFPRPDFQSSRFMVDDAPVRSRDLLQPTSPARPATPRVGDRGFTAPEVTDGLHNVGYTRKVGLCAYVCLCLCVCLMV